MVQRPGLSSPTSEAQTRHLAGAPRPCQLHGMEDKIGKKETNRQYPRTNGKSKTKEIKSHKETHTHTLTKRKKKKNQNKKRKRATKSINKPTNENKHYKLR